jgi:hypothetical protein
MERKIGSTKSAVITETKTINKMQKQQQQKGILRNITKIMSDV